jgi:hypothetical protein
MDFLREGSSAGRIATELHLAEEQVRVALDDIAVHRRTIEAEYEMILRHRTPKAGANMPQWNESVQWHGEVVNAFFSTMLLF